MLLPAKTSDHPLPGEYNMTDYLADVRRVALTHMTEEEKALTMQFALHYADAPRPRDHKAALYFLINTMYGATIFKQYRPESIYIFDYGLSEHTQLKVASVLFHELAHSIRHADEPGHPQGFWDTLHRLGLVLYANDDPLDCEDNWHPEILAQLKALPAITNVDIEDGDTMPASFEAEGDIL